MAAEARGNEEAGEGSNKPDSKKERNETMKKLMIVAAVAAMAGGAFAYDGYNFTATLKTTQGRKGTDVITTLNLGKSGSTFWYQDAEYVAITNIASEAWYATKDIQGSTVPTVKKTQTKDGAAWNQKGAYLLKATADNADYTNVVAKLKNYKAETQDLTMVRNRQGHRSCQLLSRCGHQEDQSGLLGVGSCCALG